MLASSPELHVKSSKPCYPYLGIIRIEHDDIRGYLLQRAMAPNEAM